MSKPHWLMALALLASACGSVSASSHDGATGQAAGMDGGAGGQSGAAGAAGAALGGQGGAVGGQGGAVGGQGGAAGGQGGAAGGQGGAAGGVIPPLTACFTVDQTTAVSTPCAVTCGNGSIDSCKYVLQCPGSGGQCPTETFTEICDGGALGTSTCASLGYAGGTLRCGDWCGFDTRACDACEHGAGIAGCVSAVPEVVEPDLLALATTDAEIAIAWADGSSQSTRTGLRFARFRPDLSRLSVSECFGPAAPTQLALAATPSGWLVAATTLDGLHVFALSPTGAPSGQERVIAGAQDPMFVGRPTAGPLLYWTQPSQTFAALVRADGSNETTPVVVFPYAIDTSAGVFTGDGFLLASRLAQIVTTRIGTDGHVASQMTLQSTLKPSGYAPGLTWNGTSAAIDYSSDNDPAIGGSSLAWLRVDQNGTPLGAATVVGSSPFIGTSSSVSGAPIASLGAQILLMSSPTQSSLQVARVDGAGAAAGQPFGLTHDPALVRSYLLGKRGTEVIAAWITNGSYRSAGAAPGRIGLARLAP